MKYIVELNLDYDKNQFLEFINRKSLDYEFMAEQAKWFNNFPIEEL